MCSVAAPHIPAVNAAILAAYEGTDRGRGDLAALAREADVSRNAVSGWMSGRVTPDKELWPLIERHLGLPAGLLARTAARYFDPSIVELEALAATNEQFALARGARGGRAPKNAGTPTTRPRPRAEQS
jgi:transcriptional regulator with XRE-family HTH domain